MTVAVDENVTIDQYLRMPDRDIYDLIDGELVERPMDAESEWIGGQILSLMNDYLKRNPIGFAFGSSANYRALPESGQTFNRPDASFVSGEKMPGGDIPKGVLEVWPDLVVEVVSPTDPVYRTDRKVEEFLAGGTRLVLVVNPETRRSIVHRRNGSATKLTDADSFDGEDVMPGLKFRMADVLPRKRR